MQHRIIFASILFLAASSAKLFAQAPTVDDAKPTPAAQTQARMPLASASSSGNLDDVKKQIHASDEEWKVVGPKLRKVISARQVAEAGFQTDASNSAFGAGFFGGPGGPGWFGPPGGPGGFGRGNFGPPGGGPGGRDSFDVPGSDAPPNFDRRDFNGRGGGPIGQPGEMPNDRQPPESGRNQSNGTPATRGGNQSFSMRNQRPPNFAGGPMPFGLRNNAVSRAINELQTVAADKSSTPEQIQEKVAAVRTARRKAQDDLAAAQKDLLLLLTPRQEAVLIGLGYLE